MGRPILLNLALLFTLVACMGGGERGGEGGDTAVPHAHLPTKAAATLVIPTTPTLAATPTPAPLMPPSSTPIAPDSDLSLDAGHVFLYPIPEIYSGDRVTFQVLPYVPPQLIPESVTVQVSVDGQMVAGGSLGGRNLAGQAMGLFQWAWDTTGLSGTHTIQVQLDPDDKLQIGDENQTNNLVTILVTVADRQTLPPVAANATWITAETLCCYIHAVTDTAAYRDLPQLLEMVETAVDQASDRLFTPLEQKIHIYFIDRVIGQGGYAATSIVISYLDRPYAGRGIAQVLTHEATHLLDRQFAPQRIAPLAEGLAVWTTGGHYKAENLDPRMASLVEIGEYIPLYQLLDDFYPVQHEIGYLEMAGLVSYLVQRNGWEQFKAFYTDTTADDAPTLTEVVDQNLQIYYGLTLADMEAEWLMFLQQQRPSYSDITDLQTTLRYYNLMRHYQTIYDPTAYFLTAWLPYPQDVQNQGNPADLTRHPNQDVNIALETMLSGADQALRSGEYELANGLLDSVERVLQHDGSFLDPLALSYLQIVQKALSVGYEPQQITLTGDTAVVQVTSLHTTNLLSLRLAWRGHTWVILSN